MEASTGLYFEREAPKCEWYHRELMGFEKAGLFYQRHFSVLEGLAITGLILGLIALASIAPSHFLLKSPFFRWVVPVLGSFGGSLLLFSSIAVLAWKILGLFFPADRKERIFKEGTVDDPERKLYGKISLLANGTPCLMIPHADDPVQSGRTHGYLAAPALYKKLDAIRHAVWLLSLSNSNIKALTSKEGQAYVRGLIDNLPREISTELKSVVEGFHFWCNDHKKPNKGFSLEELYVFHLMQDGMQVNFKAAIDKKSRQQASLQPKQEAKLFGCTTFVAGDSVKGMHFMRLLDWETGGVFHLMSMVIAKQFKDATQTLDLGYAGMIGSYTSMNNHGCALAMNVALVCLGENHLEDPNALPASIFNTLLAQKQSVQDMVAFISDGLYAPIAPYHLTIADEKSAATIHLYQNQRVQKTGENWSTLPSGHLIRYKKENQPLYLTNPTYDSTGGSTDRYGLSRYDGVLDAWESAERESRLQKAWDGSIKHAEENAYEHSPKEVAQSISKIGRVNNFESTHAVYMNLDEKTFAFAVSSNYAGTKERLSLSFKEVFSAAIFKSKVILQ